MKIRSGFVSNSSSSSFILSFDSLPESVEDLMKVLNFEDIHDFGEGGHSNKDYAERIFEDIYEGKNPSDDDIKELFGNDSYYEVSEMYSKAWNEKDSVKRKKLIEAADNKYEALKEKKLKEFKKANKGKTVSIVRYSDNDSHFEADLEHSNFFTNIDHVYINQH